VIGAVAVCPGHAAAKVPEHQQIIGNGRYRGDS
jgi:hypothetical protein